MSFPKYKDIQISLLQYLHQLGGSAEPAQLYELLAEFFALTPAERNQSLDSEPQRNKWENMVRWARNDLVKLGHIAGDERNVWKLTEAGEKRVMENSSQKDSKVNESLAHSTAWWWVNQNKTYHEEHDGGFIWAPQRTKSGSEAFHHANLAKVKKGDVIWHYYNQRLVAVSIAESDAFEEPKPEELGAGDWENNGYMARVRYVDLLEPVHRDSIPVEFRTSLSNVAKSPFNSGGTVNQGYLFALPNSFVGKMLERFPQLLPKELAALGVKSPDLLFEDLEAIFIELRDKFRNLNVNRDYGTIKLYKPGIVLAVLEKLDTENWNNAIRFDDILPAFRSLMRRYDLKSGMTQAEEAFFRLDKDGVWSYVPLVEDQQISGLEPARLRKIVSHAEFPTSYWEVISNSGYRHMLRDDLISTWFKPESEAFNETPAEPFLRDVALSQLIDDIKYDGYIYEPWQIATYVTALRTKPFVILAGISGSGKSQLPQLVANITGGLKKVIPVRPDWNDSSDVLGYVQLHGRFNPGKLLKFAAEATAEPNLHYCAIIDEMNIARVEHYFAEVLSLVEQRRLEPDGLHPLFDQDFENDDDSKWNRIGLPSNLAIVGTVNMDESTHGFSRKVLDRAFTLEFSDIHLDEWEAPGASIEYQSKSWSMTAWLPRAARLSDLKDLSNSERSLVDGTIAVLLSLNELLSQAQLQIAYRSRDEIVLFVLHANEVLGSFVDWAGEKVDPLDVAIQMKVLPRIAGGSPIIKTLLQELLGFAYNGKPGITVEDSNNLIRRWEKDRKPPSIKGANLPRTCARLCLMLHRLVQGEGYTSYWL